MQNRPRPNHRHPRPSRYKAINSVRQFGGAWTFELGESSMTGPTSELNQSAKRVASFFDPALEICAAEAVAELVAR